MLIARVEKQKLAAARKPRQPRKLSPESRTVPAAVRRAVWQRDAGRCAYEGAEGRCAERGFLEFHHVHPYARGGAATVENVQLRCRNHNQYEAEAAFGKRMMLRERAPAYGAARSEPSSVRCAPLARGVLSGF